MNHYYVLRLGADFKILYMDRAAAREWEAAGWEIRAHDSNEKAQLAMEAWKARVQHQATLSIVARRRA